MKEKIRRAKKKLQEQDADELKELLSNNWRGVRSLVLELLNKDVEMRYEKYEHNRHSVSGEGVQYDLILEFVSEENPVIKVLVSGFTSNDMWQYEIQLGSSALGPGEAIELGRIRDKPFSQVRDEGLASILKKDRDFVETLERLPEEFE